MALKAELVTNNELQNNETASLPVMSETGIVDVESALESWNNYQELCKQLLDDNDYQKIEVKEKDESGNYITVERAFRKKSAWFKLGRAFNVKTEIIEKTVERGKNGQVKEAYYRVRASLPNGRVVEADASCDVWEKGKARMSGHDLRTTAETRATNRAIAKLIGAGEVSAEEINNNAVSIDKKKDSKLLAGDKK